jgi:hypothetical protein
MAKTITQPPTLYGLPFSMTQHLDALRVAALRALNAETPTERYRHQKEADLLYQRAMAAMSYERPLTRRSSTYKPPEEAMNELLGKGWVVIGKADTTVINRLQQLDKRTAIRQFRGRFTNWTTTYIAPSYLVELARVTDNSDLLNKALRAKTDRANIVEAAKFINASQD